MQSSTQILPKSAHGHIQYLNTLYQSVLASSLFFADECRGVNIKGEDADRISKLVKKTRLCWRAEPVHPEGCELNWTPSQTTWGARSSTRLCFKSTDFLFHFLHLWHFNYVCVAYLFFTSLICWRIPKNAKNSAVIWRCNHLIWFAELCQTFQAAAYSVFFVRMGKNASLWKVLMKERQRNSPRIKGFFHMLKMQWACRAATGCHWLMFMFWLFKNTCHTCTIYLHEYTSSCCTVMVTAAPLRNHFAHDLMHNLLKYVQTRENTAYKAKTQPELS